MHATDGTPHSDGVTHFPAAHSPRDGIDPASQPAIPPNRLLEILRASSPAEYDVIAPQLETVDLALGDVLCEPGESILHAYFPEGCVSSMVKLLGDGGRIEVGAAGVEGMIGLHCFLHACSSPLRIVIQIAGKARRLPVAALREGTTTGSVLGDLLSRYAQYAFNEAAQSIACNRLHSTGKRGARWLLMMHDRAQRDQFALTHEYLATMLGVWRPAASQTADAMRKAGLIDYRRGKMRIVDRAGLEAAACECYASDRSGYERLFHAAAGSAPSVAANGGARSIAPTFDDPTLAALAELRRAHGGGGGSLREMHRPTE